MKKIISIILAVFMLVTFSACSEKKEVDTPAGVNTAAPSKEKTPVEKDENLDAEENKDEEEVPQESEKPSAKPTETPAVKPGGTPSEAPVETPSETPSETPVETPEEPAGTLGQVLLSDFKEKAHAGMDTLAIAEALLQNPAIQFMGGAMPVEEGLLSGFDNFEVKGFKSGAVFMPMIGSIAFVGYVFELQEGVGTAPFIQSLRDNANMRWNICVTAEEMVTGAVGNKVFFVMCPTSLGE